MQTYPNDNYGLPPHLTPQELPILQAIADLGDDTGKVGEHLGLARKAITTAT